MTKYDEGDGSSHRLKKWSNLSTVQQFFQNEDKHLKAMQLYHNTPNARKIYSSCSGRLSIKTMILRLKKNNKKNNTQTTVFINMFPIKYCINNFNKYL